MKKIYLAILATCALCLFNATSAFAQKPDNIWFQFNDRFIENQLIDISAIDSIEFGKTSMKRFRYNPTSGTTSGLTKTYRTDGVYRFDTPERILARSSTYSNCDFTKETSQFCFQRSAESEHFVIFWENGLTKTSTGNISYDGYTCNVNTMLKQAENIWKCYVEKLGFLEPGKSKTDKLKIEMFIVKNGWGGAGDSWRADGSGTDATYYTYGTGTTKTSVASKIGVFHCTTRAATARNGHTLAHEIGHTFQYLVSADLGSTHGLNYGIGTGRDNEWWEDCANWQAYKVYPQYQYSDGEYYEQYLTKHHLNIHHEDIRYTSCYYQDYWCQLHGMNTVGRVWRESKKPEDPTQAYMRIFELDEQSFGDEMYQAFAHLASIDIDAVRTYGKAKIGNEPQRLIDPSNAIKTKYLNGDNDYWIVDPNFCPQNYGYNANPLKVPAAGTVVKANFKGLTECEGYKIVYPQYAGWRYGLVAYCSDGKRVYSDPCSDKEGEVSITVPEKCVNMWLVVMGAPTKYWSHAWTSGIASSSYDTNDEQWPYAVKFEGTSPLGANKTYGEFPEDYERKDTTVVVNTSIVAGSNWNYVSAPLDMDAMSQALGVSTAQLKAAVCGKKTAYPYVRIAGLNANLTTETNSKTISDTDTPFGHWFTTTGNVTTFGGSSAIYTKIYADTYELRIGQYPDRLVKGKTYIVREAVIYTDKNGKEYKAIMEIHLTAK